MALVSFVVPHLSNVDLVPLKRKELRETYLASSVYFGGYLEALPCFILLLVCCVLLHLGRLPFIKEFSVLVDPKN
jgi:hypothetical protein